MRNALYLIVTLIIVAQVWGKTFDRCSLAREMYRLGTPKSELDKWTCIAQHVSGYRTNVIGPSGPDGSKDYGIFQINDRYWCQPDSGQHSYNGCGLSCSKLLTDNIADAVHCARNIKNQQGWTAWAVWKKCKGKLPSIKECF